MSYDLALTPRQPGLPLEEDTILRYFKDRNHYAVNSGQAWYENEDTGVYFSFEVDSLEDEEQEDQVGEASMQLGFSLNLNRPPFFAREAALELDAVCSALDLLIEDPQADPEWHGDFDAEKFTALWMTSNALFPAASPDHSRSIDLEALDAIWQWNYGRADRQRALGDDVFVPPITFALVGGRPVSVTMWPDAIPQLLPQADMVILSRDTLARRSWLGLSKRPQILLTPWSDVSQVLDGNFIRRDDGALTWFEPRYRQAPDSLVAFFQAQRTLLDKTDYEPVGHDRIWELLHGQPA